MNQEAITSAQVTAAVEAAGLARLETGAAEKLAAYGNLLLRWNAHTNLTAIRTPDGIVQRHLVESVAAARLLPPGITSLLDYGSGAGLPGIPIGMARPEIAVTLAESQSRKVAFLREAARVLEWKGAIHPDRVEALPATTRFDCVVLRAVDSMAAALAEASRRLTPSGTLALFATEAAEASWIEQLEGTSVLAGLPTRSRHPLPTPGYLLLLK